MRKSENASALLLGTKLFLVVCFLVINTIMISDSKASNNKDNEEITKKHGIGGWAEVTLSEKWHHEDNHGDTTVYSLEDHSASLKFYPLKNKSTSKEMKQFIVGRAQSYGLPIFYRAVNKKQLEISKANRGGFCQGTIRIQDDRINLEDSTDMVGLAETNKKSSQTVEYIVLAGLQSERGVFILEARTTDLENVPMSISRAQRNWVLR